MVRKGFISQVSRLAPIRRFDVLKISLTFVARHAKNSIVADAMRP